MADLSNVIRDLTVEQKRVQAEVKALDKAIATLAALDGGARPGPRKKMSAVGRAKIAAAQKARWAKWKKKQGK